MRAKLIREDDGKFVITTVEDMMTPLLDDPLQSWYHALPSTAQLYMNAREAALWHFDRLVEVRLRVKEPIASPIEEYLQRDLLATLDAVGAL